MSEIDEKLRTELQRQGIWVTSMQGSNVLQGIDLYTPMDVFIPRCPPRPQALLHAFMELQRKIDGQKLTGTDKAEFLKPEQLSEFPVPKFGEHDLEPPANRDVFQPPNLTVFDGPRDP